MNRREFLKVSSAAVSVLPLTGCLTNKKRVAKVNSRPNIVFIMSDDHAAQAMSCYGSKINQTPNLDRLADEGMLFKNCFCTNCICAPSRAVILTGKYSHLNGKIDNSHKPFDGSQQTFPKLLQQAGYQTAMIGKWHLISEPTGFDYWKGFLGNGRYFDPIFKEMGNKVQHKGYVTDLITDFSIDWVKNRDKNKPFFLMYHHKAPHREWSPDEKHKKEFEKKTFPFPETFNDDYDTRCDAAREQEMTIEHHFKIPGDTKIWPPENLTGQALKEWKFQRYMKVYLACVASIDDNIGRFLDFIDSEGLTDNTIIFYTSDQGFFLGEHGWFDKRFMYEESLRMPLLARWPKKVKARSVNKDIVLNLDFAETFLDIAGVDIPGDMQGESLKPILEGKTPADWRDAMYYHYYEYPAVHMVKRHYGIRTQRYKLIHFYYDIDCWELYDLKKDPHEMNNLYDDPAYAKIVKKLTKELRQLQAKYKDSDELAKKFIKVSSQE